MQDIQTYKAVISIFPSKARLAEECGEKYSTVNQWDRRNSIPAAHWPKVIDAASRLGIPGLSLEKLMKIKSGAKSVQ